MTPTVLPLADGKSLGMITQGLGGVTVIRLAEVGWWREQAEALRVTALSSPEHAAANLAAAYAIEDAADNADIIRDLGGL